MGHSLARTMNMNTYNQLQQRLLSANLKVTMPRLLILNILDQFPSGFTALQIEKQLLKEDRKTSFPTVYNILKTFEHKGIVHRFKIGDAPACFSLIKKKGTIKMICECCKAHIDSQELTFEQNLHEALGQYYEKLNTYSVLLNVLCHECANTKITAH